MFKYMPPLAAIVVGFLLLGPLGAILGVVVWWLVAGRNS